MTSTRRFFLTTLIAAAAVPLQACSDDNPGGSGGSGGAGGSTSTSSTSSGGAGGAGGSSTGGGGTGGASEARARGFYFSQDAATNAWIVTVADPVGPAPVVATLTIEELAAISGPSGNKLGPSWGDAIPSPDGSRIFANASNANRLLVLDTATPVIEAVLPVGGKPLHIYNPNDNSEIWTHNDADGTFSVIDVDSLEVSKPVEVNLKNTGHGKLLYAQELGTDYFATNTSDPGGWSVNGSTRDATFVPLCAKACADDPATPQDESLEMCGGTHDKTYDPATNTAIFQCSGVTGGMVAFVDGTTKMVTQDLVPMAVSAFAFSHHKEYNLVFDTMNNAVNIWDSAAPGHSLSKFDATVTITGNASGRGTDFRQNASGEWEAWIPQSTGTKLVRLNLKTLAMVEIEIGTLSPPPGASSATRRGSIAGSWYFTNNDAGLVMVNLDTMEIVTAPPPAGTIVRVTAVENK
jgi:hypothetical protein